MKKLFIATLLFFSSLLIFAQTPSLFNYQTMIRNSSGQVLSEKDFNIRISIYKSTPNGELVYMEHHEKTTNKYGLINMKIGNGEISLGNLLEMDWASGPYFIETAIDSTDSYNYIVISNTQLVSVPYALHAESVTNADDADADPTNEIQNLEINGNELSIEGGNTVNIPTNDVWTQNDTNIYYKAGNVGIGTDSPEVPIHIVGYSDQTEFKTFMKIHNKTSDPWSAANVRIFSGNNTESFLQLSHKADSYSVMSDYKNTSLIWNEGEGLILQSTNSPNSHIRFQTSPQNIYTERMRLDAQGNLGIGTSNPEHKLHIETESNYTEGRVLLKLKNNQTDSHSTTQIHLEAGNNNESVLSIAHLSDTYSAIPNRENVSHLWNKGNGISLRSTGSSESSIRFETNSDHIITERMRIDYNGQLGIGTSSPQTKLHIADGDIYLEDINSGIIMKSPNGQCWKINVNNDGSLSTTSVDCP